MTEGPFMKRAAYRRALGSTQAHLDSIVSHSEEERHRLKAEYYALDKIASEMSKGYTELPFNSKKFKEVLCRMKELNRMIVVLDETIGGAKYQYDSDHVDEMKDKLGNLQTNQH